MEAPVFDAHVDALQRALDLGHDLLSETRGQFDFARSASGGLGEVVLACWVGAGYVRSGAADRASALIECGRQLCERSSGRLELVTTADQLAARGAGSTSQGALLGIEGGHAIENSLGQLERFAERGVRVMTLVWNAHLDWIRSSFRNPPAGTPKGLSRFGGEVVRRMNELGMAVDLSHAGVQAFYDALEASDRPTIVSHSGCSALHDHPRNLDDEQLRALGQSGGVIGIPFHPGFLDAQANADEQRLRREAHYSELAEQASGPTSRHLAQTEWMQAKAKPLGLERVVDHVEHALELAGPGCVGLGSDFDGIERGPAGLESASGYPHLAEAMRARGLEPSVIAGVLGDNFRRVFGRILPAGR